MQTQSIGLFVAGITVGLLVVHTYPILCLFRSLYPKDLLEKENAESEREDSETFQSPIRRTRSVIRRQRPQTASTPDPAVQLFEDNDFIFVNTSQIAAIQQQRTEESQSTELQREETDSIEASDLEEVMPTPFSVRETPDVTQVEQRNYNTPLMQESAETLNKTLLLNAIAQEKTRKYATTHRAVTCNHCQTTPLHGIRYKCANCPDFDLCQACESLAPHTLTHLFLKIAVPIAPLCNIKRCLVAVVYPGNEFFAHDQSLDPTNALYLDLKHETQYGDAELEAFYAQFRSLSTYREIGGITKETFERCLGPVGIERNLVNDRMFDFFDQNADGVINFGEFVRGISVLARGSIQERIKHAFAGYDLDGNGFISKQELQQMFRAYFSVSLELVRDVVRGMEEDVVDGFDDEAAKPVSSVFAGGIVGDGSESESGSEDEDTKDSPRQRSRSKQKLKVNFENEYSGTVLANGVAGASMTSQPRCTASRQSDTPVLSAFSAQPRPARSSTSASALPPLASLSAQSPRSPPHIAHLFAPPRLNPLSSYPPLRDLEVSLTSPTLSFGGFNYSADRAEAFSGDRGEFPMIEMLSQEAIEEMVERLFAEVDDERGIDLETFEKLVAEDTNLIAWFEALGTIF